MYNESYMQLFESLAGIYRNYSELVEDDPRFKDKVTIVIICDGYSEFNEMSTKQVNFNYLFSLENIN